MSWQKENVRLKKNPDNYDKVPVPGTGKVVSSPPETFRLYLIRRGFSEDTLKQYIAFAAGNIPPFAGMGVFENRVIREAIRFRVILAPLESAHMIADWLPTPEPTQPGWYREDEQENKLIIKTGGDQIGGQIYGAGYRQTGGHVVQRSLTTFEKTDYGSSSESSGPDTDSGQWACDVDTAEE